ncbi:MAG: hypothetical protein K0R05_4397 [Anaerocolumna sp.]|jgi:hypothetical protein|nr:hypothetical protein [Anaerocolumna sp.]
MDITPQSLNAMPKDTPTKGIPSLPCDNQEADAAELPLAMVVIRRQCFKDLNLPDEALKAGTLFKELDLPFYGTGGALL